MRHDESPVIIEFIGCTSSGKTTLLSQLRAHHDWQEMKMVMVDEAFLGKLNDKIRHKKMRSLATDFFVVIRCWKLVLRRRSLIAVVSRQSWQRNDRIWVRINLVRNFIKKLALFDYLSSRETDAHIILDEGPIQALLNIFVHYEPSLDLDKLKEVYESFPVSNYVIFVKASEQTVVNRSRSRSDPPLWGLQDVHWKNIKNNFERAFTNVIQNGLDPPKIIEYDSSVQETEIGSQNLETFISTLKSLRFLRK